MMLQKLITLHDMESVVGLTARVHCKMYGLIGLADWGLGVVAVPVLGWIQGHAELVLFH